MEENYPRYPVDFYRLRIPLGGIIPGTGQQQTAIVDIVRENPFGTAFLRRKKEEQTSKNFS